ncbi:MAG: UDP-N-acetylmuramoyl-L-alanyl-D-glutamate--2,6-diaminopimelate ligase [Alphaproteobacteria bacterium]|nr:UDP-N-acetylmuramoyl-L-alanyl-D-glutamate--2,6-diaminopimelate ligase [Alphaproteobacteria bacterium]
MELVPAPAAPDPEIFGITADSRAVKPGWLFAALPGAKADGRAFVGDALARGAVAVLGEPDLALPAGIALVPSRNPRLELARIAARFHARQPRVIAAVTGTNGKTSVAAFARQIWSELGHKAASLGTLGLVAPGRERPGSLTTPDPVALHADLAALAGEGVDHLAIEASSHGLAQHRLEGMRVSTAAFTNLTRDHLDYHGSMAAYFAAKKRLFAEVMAPGGTAVLNADTAEFAELERLSRAAGHRVIGYGHAGREITLRNVAREPHGQRLAITFFGRDATIDLKLVGEFQAMNALAALGLVVGSGVEAAQALAVLERLDGVPGRLQRAAVRANGAAVYVDYAHTPDALETILKALRPHTPRRLVVIFGCGGDRDAGKRPQMGTIAANLADRVIVTDDNPRSEKPGTIRQAILAASPGAIEIGDRRAAIFAAAAEIQGGDLLVIAGKGHEQGQIVAGSVLPFDDVTVARQAVAAADGAA